MLATKIDYSKRMCENLLGKTIFFASQTATELSSDIRSGSFTSQKQPELAVREKAMNVGFMA
jgi:hypothetical protein